VIFRNFVAFVFRTYMIELNEFFVEGGDQDRSHVLLHITEPSTPEEQDKGYFFAVCEINNGTVEQIEHLQGMIDDLESGYYETSDTDDKDAFEISLEFINKRGHHILKNTDSIVSCVVGVVRSNEILIAYHGNPIAKLFYTKDSILSAVNIVEEHKSTEPNDQLFSAVMQGNIKPNDILYVASPHVMDYLGTDRVKKIITAKTTRQASAYIEKILGNLTNDLSFGGILVDSTKTPKQKPKPTNNVTETIHNTDSLPEPEVYSFSLGKKLTSVLKSKKTRLKPAVKSPKVETNYRQQAKQEESFFALTLVTLGRALVAGFVGLYRVTKKSLILLWKALVAGILLISNKGGQRQLVLQAIEQFFERKKMQIKNLSLISKILFLLTCLLAIIFVVSLGYLKIKENRITAITVYENQIQAIVDKKTASEASMIYGDESKAFTLLQEAKELINALPDSKGQQANKKADLTTQIETSLQMLRKIKTIEPSVLADLNQVNENVSVSRLALLGDTIFAYGPGDTKLYTIDADTKNILTKDHSTIPNIIADSTPKENDMIVFLTANNQAAEYQLESGAILAKSIDVHDDSKLTNIFVYNQKLYSIDTNGNQILRHNRTQTGYDRGTAWIKDGQVADVQNGVSFAIDGDIFVLSSNGKIDKYISGRKQDFTVQGLDPELDNPIAIWTYNDVDNIYILEPTNRRVVILDKKGKLLQQYTSAEWSNPTGMVVREEKGVIYLLDNNKIYQFSLN
jgi:hypothetical protein